MIFHIIPFLSQKKQRFLHFSTWCKRNQWNPASSPLSSPARCSPKKYDDDVGGRGDDGVGSRGDDGDGDNDGGGDGDGVGAGDDDAYLIFVRDTTDGVCVEKNCLV